jgi:hypothetical protein
MTCILIIILNTDKTCNVLEVLVIEVILLKLFPEPQSKLNR